MNTMRATSSLQSALRTSARVQPRMMLGARSYASGGAQNVPTTGQGSSQPAKGPEVDRHNMSQAANVAHATGRVNQFAKRDPSLYPLSVIVALALGCAGYFFATKATGIDDPAKALTQHGLVAPWESSDKHDTAGKVAEFKYRYKSREGHMMDAAPTLSSQTVKLKEGVNTKFSTA